MAKQAWWRASGILLAALACGACASYSNVRFSPPIQNAELRDGDEVQARIAIAWRGVVERDGGYEFLFRCRVENALAKPFQIAPAEFELVDGALASLGAPYAEGLPDAVAPGQEATFDLAFPLGARTPDDADLAALDLRVRFDSGRWHWSTAFQRLVDYAGPYPYYGYYDPWWGSHFSFHAGVVFCHH